jgi:hypothetical protein
MPPSKSYSLLPPESSSASHHPPSSDTTSSPVHVSQASSRTPSPFVGVSSESSKEPVRKQLDDSDDGSDVELLELRGNAPPDDTVYHDDQDEDDMPSDLRPTLHRPTDGRSQTPLLGHKRDSSRGSYNSPSRSQHHSRRSTGRLHERDPEIEAKAETRRRYTIALLFLLISLISFTIQTETAVYIQKNLHWEKAYCML